MEPETQTAPSQSPAPENSPISPSPKNSWLTSFLFLVLGILVGAGGLWGYQKYFYNLSNQQINYSSPTPIATTDPTADWKTYTDDVRLFSFKYPESINGLKFSIENSQKQLLIGGLITIQSEQSTIELKKWWSGLYKDWVSRSIFKETTFKNLPAIEVTFPKDSEFGYERVFLTNYAGRNYSFFLQVYNCDNSCPEKTMTDQILSTFKFLEVTASPSATQKACTLEAKLCPDGSSVGRTGPNCEFAACP